MIRRNRPEPQVEALERMRQPVLADARPDADARRSAAIAGMSRMVRAEARRRRRSTLWPVAAAAGVLAVIGLTAWMRFHGLHADSSVASSTVQKPQEGTVELRVDSGVAVATRRGVPTALSSAGSLRIAQGDAVRTGPDARASLLLPRGVRVELSRATKASILSADDDDQKLALDIGETFISVPRPGGPHTFSVTTPDARVVVHGTEFTVRVDPAEGARSTNTSVSVTRGAVSVIDESGERLLHPGESWSAAIESKGAAMREPAAPTPEPVTSRARASSVKESPSSLAEQNRLFQAALDARRSGDDMAVLKAVDELFARYPETTLAEEARLVRFRALKALHRNQDAAREAKRYLSAHPDAPAADEARRALLESTTGAE